MENGTLYSTPAFGNGCPREDYLTLLTTGFLFTLIFPVTFMAIHVPVVSGIFKHY